MGPRTEQWINRPVALSGSERVHKPLGLLAELTHRCPLGCPYCSNPLALDARGDELDTATWARVFREAAQLGVLQVHLSGGEPGARRDLVDVTAGAHAAGLYTNLITSAVGITDKTLGALTEAGLDHVQISIQDSENASADHIAGYDGAFARKRALATEVAPRQLLLTVNAVVHRANIDRIGRCQRNRPRCATSLPTTRGSRSSRRFEPTLHTSTAACDSGSRSSMECPRGAGDTVSP
jgi:PqqA peptide cyclase